MKKFKTLITLILSVILAVNLLIPAIATTTEAELLTVYSDGMLFKQNDIAVLEGKAAPSSEIVLFLKDSSGNTITEEKSVTGSDGVFTVSFFTPEGSFSEYSITLLCNGKAFRTLNNIVFGELWLASGQSNMQYPLIQSPTGAVDAANNKKLSYWLRTLLVPAYPEYNGSTSSIPYAPQKDITDAVWINGEDSSVYSMSAVAYFFAEQLLKELNMPVGILNASLGGSSLRSWLSRDAIDSCPEVKQYLQNEGAYFEKSNWKENEQNVYYDMTANFNQKIAPLANFSISGMIWYQGETDLMFGNTQYDKQFDLMQKSYSELFGYDDALLPIVYTQLASYNYSDDGNILSDWNINYTEMQLNNKDSRAVITINDIPLTYLPEVGLIHPHIKETVGQRMAYSALGLVYDKYDSYSAPYVKSTILSDNSIYVTFGNVGDGLICTEEAIKGFAICSENNIYVDAKAQIISADTVKVWSDTTTAPIGVTYAYGVCNQTANLFASSHGQITLPVSVLNTKPDTENVYWADKPWTYCDDEKVWFTEDDAVSGYYDAWTCENAVISVNKDNTLSSGNGLGIRSQVNSFSISPTISYKSGIKKVVFKDAESDYSNYESLSFLVRNNGTEPVVFDGLRLYKSSALWYTPRISGTLDNSFVIPADGNTYTITLNLNQVNHADNECSLTYGNKKLKNINELEFCFSSSADESDISIDAISFSASNGTAKTSYEVDIANADNILEYFTGIFLMLFSKIVSIFK